MNLANLSDDDRKVIAVDFDKTLTTGEGPDFWEDDEQEYPNDSMVSWVNEQYHDGNIILIWTARPWTQAATVESYLVKWGVEYHGLRCNKTGADLYVDDKAQNVEKVEAHSMVLAAQPDGDNVWTQQDVDEFMDDVETDTCGFEEGLQRGAQEAASDRPKDDEDEPECDDSDFFDGTVEFYNESGRYGFIESTVIEEDVFFHMGDLNSPEPEEGYEVTFKYEVRDNGPAVTEFYNVDPPA